MPDEPTEPKQGGTAAHRAEVEALPRPDIGVAGLDSRGVMAEARKAAEIDTTTRVYRKDWLFDTRHTTEEGARIHFATKYAGRIIDDDWRITPAPIGPGVYLEIRKWNILGEFKTQELAEEFVQTNRAVVPDTEDVRIVTRNSRDEHLLMDYGVKKLVNTPTKTRAVSPTE